MSETQPAQRVEVRCVGAPPVQRIERAAGVSEVQAEGPIVRCLVSGSFQPFLEALHGSEVVSLQSTPVQTPPTSAATEGIHR